MIDFLRRLFGHSGSSSTAKERLRLVLMTDHLELSPELVDSMKRDLVDVISRYVEVDREKIDVSFERQDQALAMLANIPILAVNRATNGHANEAVAVEPPVDAPEVPAPLLETASDETPSDVQPSSEAPAVEAAVEPAAETELQTADFDDVQAPPAVREGQNEAAVEGEGAATSAELKRRRRRRKRKAAAAAAASATGTASAN
ncbi:MAG TPA: cell division topological specificity factor MinE [Candidatus Tumulicola sp.]